MTISLFAQMMVNPGIGILVVCCLAALAMIGFFLLAYFAHCFLTVVIDSAGGIDEIRWPSEFITEWLTKPMYLLWVLLPILFLPSLMLAASGDGIAFCVTLVVLLWCVSPILILSSLAAKSWMTLLYGPFLKRWARFFFAYVIFLVWSGLLTALGVALLVWSMKSLGGVATAAIFLPPLFLLYFRVLGRYAWYVTTRRMRRPKMKDVNPAKGHNVESLDPWAMPPNEITDPMEPARLRENDDTTQSPSELTDLRDQLMPADQRDKVAAGERSKVVAAAEETVAAEDEWTPNKKPYLVMTEVRARESWLERQGTTGNDIDGYDVEKLSIGQPVSLWQYYSEREKKEEELRDQGKAVRQYVRPRKPPTLWQAMTQEIAGFLFYSHTLRAWMTLSILFLVELGLLQIIVQITGMIQAAS